MKLSSTFLATLAHYLRDYDAQIEVSTGPNYLIATCHHDRRHYSILVTTDDDQLNVVYDSPHGNPALEKERHDILLLAQECFRHVFANTMMYELSAREQLFGVPGDLTHYLT